MGKQKPSAQVLDVPTAPAAKAPVCCNAEPLGSQGVGECELEPREGCFWPSATPGLLAKSLLAAQALPATSAAAFLLVDIRGSSAPRKELGFRIGTRGRPARDQPGAWSAVPTPLPVTGVVSPRRHSTLGNVNPT